MIVVCSVKYIFLVRQLCFTVPRIAKSHYLLKKKSYVFNTQFQSLLGKQSRNSISAFSIPGDMLSIMKHIPLHFGKCIATGKTSDGGN